MSSKKQHKPVVKARATSALPKAEEGGILRWFETFFEKKHTGIFWTLFTLFALCIFLQFDVKLSTGNDDALYIDGAYNFWHQFPDYFYTINAPLYPMLLSIPVGIFGINLPVLKIISAVFMLLHFYFFYKALYGRIPHLLLFPVLFIVSVNTLFIFYASMTYTEAFFLCVQSAFLLHLVKLQDTIDHRGEHLRETWKNWMWIGFMTLLLVLTKSVAMGVVGCLAVYFLLQKKFYSALYSVAAYFVFRIPYDLIKKMIWGNVSSNVDSQMKQLLQVDPYDISKGMETTQGLINRFFENADLYVSKRMFQILGFRSDDSVEISTALTYIVAALLIFGVVRAFTGKKRIVWFMGFYTAAMCLVSFVMLQTRWDQPRIIMVYVPLILITVFYGLYSVVTKLRSFPMEFALFLLISIVTFAGFGKSVTRSVKNVNILKHNLKGDIYYGYTPDWTNFLKMSAWCAANLPDTALVGSRKGSISFVYGNGKKFYSIYTAFSDNADSILTTFKKDKVTHLLIASLRRNPAKNDGYVINTLQRLYAVVEQKYPGQKFKLIRQEGDSEPAYLFQIIY